jgi:hypothetical protein
MFPDVLRKPKGAQDIAQGARLSKMHGRDITPLKVVQVLDAAQIAYVLVGAHAVNGYTGAPRATTDVDVVVRFPKKATLVLLRAFPELTPRDTPVVTRLARPDGEYAIDVMKASTSPLWQKMLKIARPVRMGKISLRIPPVEGVLAAKMAAMASPHRHIAKKMIDGGDFIQIVQVSERIDSRLAKELGELVYPGGGKEILKLIADALAGRRLEF